MNKPSTIYVDIPSESELDDRLFESMQSNNRKLNILSKVLAKGGFTCTLKDLLNPDSMYLILRMSGHGCDRCIDEIIKRLPELEARVACLNMLIIASDMSVRDITVKMNAIKKMFPCYVLSESSMGLPADETAIPYIMFVDDGKTSKHVLLLGNAQPYLTDIYFKFIAERYCSD